MTNKVSVGFVGTGGMGAVLMQRITERDDAEVIALFETNRQGGQEVVKNLAVYATHLKAQVRNFEPEPIYNILSTCVTHFIEHRRQSR